MKISKSLAAVLLALAVLNISACGPKSLFISGTTGNVGIGTTSPGTKLEVNGTVSANAFSNTSPLILEAPVGTERMRIDNVTGNVGIGTTSPGTKLEVNGTVSANVFSSTSPLILEAPVGTERMRIDDVTGNVGIGTTSPSRKLDVKGAVFADNGGSDHLGEQQSLVIGGGGFFAFRQSSDGMTLHLDRYKYISPLAAEWHTPILSMRRDNGNVGIGTTNPNTRLMVVKTGWPGTAIWGEADEKGIYGYATSLDGNTQGVFGKSDSSHPNAAGVYGVGVNTGVKGYGIAYDFYAAGPGIHYGTPSSIRWKENIIEIDNALDKILNIRGVYFDWDDEHGGEHDMGFIAEEVGKYIPEIVAYEKDGVSSTGIDYAAITPVLVQAIKELKGENETLKQEIEKIKEAIGYKAMPASGRPRE